MSLYTAKHRPSTRKVYHNHWEDWKRWCRKNRVPDPTNPRTHQVANYLAHLSKDKGLSAATLKTRRAAISAVLTATGRKNVTQSSMVSGIIKGAENLQPRRDNLVPDWDLAVVLHYLKSGILKNNRLLNLTMLTYKTAFLLALATGRRASELSRLSGLDADISHAPDGTIHLKFLPGFLAKNQKPSDASPSIKIKPLNRSVDPDQKDVALCPVKALKEYRARSARIRSVKQRALLISVNPGYSQDITRATLSRWLKTTIRNAYLHLKRSRKKSKVKSHPAGPGRARAHEIRAWATTMASTTTPLADVMRAAY